MDNTEQNNKFYKYADEIENVHTTEWNRWWALGNALEMIWERLEKMEEKENE